jgi:xylulokinase
MAVLGLDLGTTTCKGVAYHSDGTPLVSARRAYRLIQPRPGWAELDAEDVWLAVQHVIRSITSACHEPVEALAVASMGESVVPVDAHGAALGPFLVSFDSRSLQQTEQLRELIGADEIFNLSGQILHPMLSATKILWMCRSYPDLATRTAHYLCAGDFVARKLGLSPTIDPSMAARTGLYDISHGNWSSMMLEAIGVKSDQLAAVLPSGARIGPIPAERASPLGLGRDVTLAVGGHDQPCAALGAGSVNEGDVTYSLGTTETLVCPLTQFVPQLQAEGYPCYPHVVRDRFVTLGGNFTGGILLQWFRNTFGDKEIVEADVTGRDPYDLLIEEMADVPTDLLVLPHFTMTGTPWNDAESAGAIIGLHLGTTRAEVIRALMEGVTDEILLNVRHLEAFGVPIAACRAVGGGTQARKVMQLKANVLGKPLIVGRDRDAACRGAALLAAQATGLIPDVRQSTEAWQDGLHCVSPQEEIVRFYAAKHRRYERMYSAVKGLLQVDEEIAT